MDKTAAKTKVQEKPFHNILFTILLPGIILNKFSAPEKLGPTNGLIVALAFPIGYMIYDYIRRREISFISGLGFVSILLTGVFGLYQLPGEWIAVKEASVPSIICLAILLSMRTSSPLVKRLIYNDSVMDVDLVERRLVEPDHKRRFEKLLSESSYLLAGSFLFSAVLNYLLAKFLLTSAPGTPAFNEELGKMNLLSWPIIALPSTVIMGFALYRLMKGIEAITGLKMDEVLKSGKKS